jgi:predicted glycoside hydrolase/deacetylase ChbG (UPF0249 family)
MSRHLIVNADDFGRSLGVNAGIAEAHHRGIVTSTSLMVLQPAATNAAHLAAAFPRLAVGIHLDLCEWQCVDYEWSIRYQRADLDNSDEVDAEVRRQLERFEVLIGRPPTHIDSHQHVHRSGVASEVIHSIAAERNLPVRGTGIPYIGKFYGQSGKGFSLPDLISVDALLEVLASIPDGWSELGCHPGFAEDLDDVYATERRVELTSLCDPRVQEFLERSEIELASFADLRSPQVVATRRSRSLRRARGRRRTDAVVRDEIAKLHRQLIEVREELAASVERVARDSAAHLRDLEDLLVSGLEDQLDDGNDASERMSPAEYRLIVRRLRMQLRRRLPDGANVAIVSRGDGQLLDIVGRSASHFPQGGDGEWSGAHPGTSNEAIAQLEAARARGIDFLAIPAPAFWWLEHYADFRHHLDRNYSRIIADDMVTVFDLNPGPSGARFVVAELADAVALCCEAGVEAPSVLDLGCGLDLGNAVPQCSVFSPPEQRANLPYLDESVDIVVVPASASPTMRAEALRVSSGAVISIGAADPSGIVVCRDVTWKRMLSPKRSVAFVVACDGDLVSLRSLVLGLAKPLAQNHEASLALVGDGDLRSLQELLPSDMRDRVSVITTNGGRAATWNAGVGETDADTLIFLSADQSPFGRWWTALLQALDPPLHAGAVGGWVLQPSGSLAEAGVSLDASGSPVRIGYGEIDLRAAQLARVREVDAVVAGPVALPRSILADAGGFDASLTGEGAVMFDMCRRVAQLGHRIVSQPSCLSIETRGWAASPDEARLLFERWGSGSAIPPIGPLQPRAPRFDHRAGVPLPPGYVELRERVAQFIRDSVPQGSRVLVVSRGDDALVRFDGIEGVHFPSGTDGNYAGYHPANNEHALELLDEQRRLGADFLLVPDTFSWWLDHYGDFADHLERHASDVVREVATGVLFDLRVAEPLGAPRSIPNSVGPLRPPLVAPSDRVIDALRPTMVAHAGNGSTSETRMRVLVLGVYLAAKETNAEHVVTELGAAARCDVMQCWVALGGEPPTDALADATVRTVLDKVPKFELLNDLVQMVDVEAFDYIVFADDDIVLPHGFLDQFIALQHALDFSLAQPARTSRSYIDQPIVEQQLGVLARRTLFVEIGPVFSVARAAYSSLLPFDLTSPMGWGYENVWASQLTKLGLTMGIIDATPVDHSLRKPVANYSWDSADRGRTELWNAREHLPLDECYRVLEVFPSATWSAT